MTDNIVAGNADNIAGLPYDFFNVGVRTTRQFRDGERTIAQEISYTAVLKHEYPGEYLQDISVQLLHLFHAILQEFREVYRDFDFIRVFITHTHMPDCNIVIEPTYMRYMDAGRILREIGKVCRSNAFIRADKGLQINVAAVRNIRGKAFLSMTNPWNELIKKKSIISIQNLDILCLPRAIAVGIAYENYHAHPKDVMAKRTYETIRKNGKGLNNLQRKTALKYLDKANLPIREGLLSDVTHYEKALKVGISVYSALSGNRRIYMGDTQYPMQINLYHYESKDGKYNHFCVITKVNALRSRSYYCVRCDKGFQNQKVHNCISTCNLCNESNCFQIQVHPCPNCNAPCRSQQCLDTHLEKKQCESMLFCPQCRVSLHSNKIKPRNLKHHRCGETFCKNCKVFYLPEEESHQCYMKGTPSLKQNQRFIFYDFESMQEGESDHIPNLVIAHSICEHCEENTHVTLKSKCNYCGSRCSKCNMINNEKMFKKPPCNSCGLREMIFSGPDTVNEFCQWLIHPQHHNTIVIAHNAKAYDNYFIYAYLLRASIIPNIIFNGSKIMYCQIPILNIKLLDSVNFLPMPLAALPKSFGLTELKKGFFPHLYNTFEMKEPYLSHLPDVSYYDPDQMYQSRREEFFTWYETNYNTPFDFYTDLIDYCRSDVNILLNACWKFRQLILDVTNGSVDPFSYVTIASVCMGIFRNCFLPETWEVVLKEDENPSCSHEKHTCICKTVKARKQNANAPLQMFQNEKWVNCKNLTAVERFVNSPIALLPPFGYARRDNYSKQAMQWLNIFESTYPEKITIQTAESNEGEKKVFYFYENSQHSFSLDGFFKDAQGNSHALEFNGCYYHGCPKCFTKDRKIIKLGNKSLNQRYNETMFKKRMLQTLGYIVHSIWGCEFAEKLKTEWSNFQFSPHIKNPLDIRDCYYGGRTNALILNKTFNKDEKAGYVDFCSLYPYALKYFTYPVGHPIRILKHFLPVEEIKCAGNCSEYGTQCPRIHKKLPYFGVIKAYILPPTNLYHPILPLKCKGKLMFTLCYHCALQQDIKHKCKCSDKNRSLYGTWCTPEVNAALTMGYQIQCIDEILHWSTSSDDLFKEYIDTFLYYKALASGFPDYVKTDEDKQNYVEEYNKKEGICLDINKIKKNPGLRSIAKLALNSFYGKFGQRENLGKCSFVHNADDLYHVMADPSKKLSDFHILNDRMMMLEYCTTPEFQIANPKSNVVISAFCSSYARLHLWKLMNELGQRVLYHDTDSVIYTYLPDETHPSQGEFLGELTNELACHSVGCSGCVEGHWIDEFVSCGPKNYAYHVNSGQNVCKVRGFSLTYAASQIIHFDALKKSLFLWYDDNDDDDDMITLTTCILRDKKQARIYTKKVPKKYSVVYNKRCVNPDFTTHPFGYKDI